jgi:hypothetical protein
VDRILDCLFGGVATRQDVQQGLQFITRNLPGVVTIQLIERRQKLVAVTSQGTYHGRRLLIRNEFVGVAGDDGV